ncbi:MAG: NADPH-dependent glutamate synthase [Lentisphaerae bacterium]|mgnify:FL=1|nr:NADPH-dependent glutamate synthase [Lentisphaerota bacterium]
MSENNTAALQELARPQYEELKKLDFQLKPAQRAKIPLQEMPVQDAELRRKNTSEVALGYTPMQAVVEANRCLQCKNQPCVEGCPVRLPIRDFIKSIAVGDFAEAIRLIKVDSLLPAVCGRVCPQETQCQVKCTLAKVLKDPEQAVSIGRLERFVADWERNQGKTELPQCAPDSGKKVAVIGSGPAGITVAADCRRAGHAVTVFEAFHKFGGVMMYGIPEFRLPKAIVEAEVELLRRMGVQMLPNFLIGRSRKLQDLLDKDGYDAVFIGIGAGLPNFMGIEGENLIGVSSANEYLTRANLMRAYERDKAATPIAEAKRVAVLGGGNVAMDAARTALRLGAEEVYLIYRRSEKEMPARVEEIHHAREEGVQFHLLRNAKRVLGNEEGRVTALECLCYELGEPDASGRRSPVAVPGSEYVLPLDAVIVAIGNSSNPLIRQTTEGLEFNKWGNLVCDEDGRTSLPRVFAGGDIVLGAATVILAMGQGRKAAAAINKMLAEGGD